MKAGEAFMIPAVKMDEAKNTGAVPLKLIGNIYVVEKGKLLAIPVKPAQ